MGNCFRLTVHLPRLRQGSRQTRVARHIPHTSAGKLHLGQRTLALLLVFVMGGLGILYLMFVNVRVTKGFEIKTLEKRLTELEKDQQKFQLEAAELQSIQTIEKSVNLQSYVPTQNPHYLSGSSVAMNGR